VWSTLVAYMATNVAITLHPVARPEPAPLLLQFGRAASRKARGERSAPAPYTSFSIGTSTRLPHSVHEPS
jgi:hypothetical protein